MRQLLLRLHSTSMFAKAATTGLRFTLRAARPRATAVRAMVSISMTLGQLGLHDPSIRGAAADRPGPADWRPLN